MRDAMNRRQALALGTGAVVAATLSLRAGPARAAKNNSEEAIKAFTRGKEPVRGRSGSNSPRSPRTATPCR